MRFDNPGSLVSPPSRPCSHLRPCWSVPSGATAAASTLAGVESPRAAAASRMAYVSGVPVPSLLCECWRTHAAQFGADSHCICSQPGRGTSGSITFTRCPRPARAQSGTMRCQSSSRGHATGVRLTKAPNFRRAVIRGGSDGQTKHPDRVGDGVHVVGCARSPHICRERCHGFSSGQAGTGHVTSCQNACGCQRLSWVAAGSTGVAATGGISDLAAVQRELFCYCAAAARRVAAGPCQQPAIQ
eukprot:COSAG05_NODE_960_length_6421_cov_17.990668_3_plen_243_part_00